MSRSSMFGKMALLVAFGLGGICTYEIIQPQIGIALSTGTFLLMIPFLIVGCIYGVKA